MKKTCPTCNGSGYVSNPERTDYQCDFCSNIVEYNRSLQQVSGGTVEVIKPGYGSRYDDIVFTIVICDDCLGENCEQQD